MPAAVAMNSTIHCLAKCFPICFPEYAELTVMICQYFHAIAIDSALKWVKFSIKEKDRNQSETTVG